jgi:nucleoside-diphosphate-sugar epimerase
VGRTSTTGAADRARRIVLTGASGCVGHRVARRLLARPGDALHLVARDPARLAPELRSHPRATLHVGDARDAGALAETIRGADALVLAHTSWGEHAFETNVDATLALVDHLDASRRPHIIHLSTASILARDGSFLAEAESLGTPYIRSKLAATRALLSRRDASVTVLYPTLVVGAGADGPASHLARLLRKVAARDRLLRFISADASFHLVHASDIASVVARVLDDLPAPGAPRELVLGGPPVSADALVDAVLAARGRRRLGRVPLSPALAELCIRLFRVQVAPWDRHCLATRHFTYDHTVDATTFGDAPAFDSLESLVASALAD